MNFAERMKIAMMQSGFTQGRLAKEAGIAQSMIWKLVSGKAEKTGSLVKIASVLGVRPEWLSDGIGPMREEKKEITSTEVSYVGTFPVALYEQDRPTGHSIPVPDLIKSDSCRAYRLNTNSGCAEAPAGTIVVVDSSEEAGNGDLVYAKIGGGYSVYRFVQGGASGFLSVDDSRVPLVPVDSEVEFFGVIIFLIRNLKRG
ncbi:helix-turn-helix domain-containing protein [Yersinia pekkanenii]|uniref:Repressor protein CI n=1 Tax=Yersinia pekkanenii TaxID=1288385 RepID=A0A0T9RR41_9GAMM|nr:helix-turn-helix domain-containing protein [Yersinia pekkanenii]CNI78544.1 repressor protein CI [Yersinia pekkanenii]CRY69597.1 repressor protein CI [Yersinia pekkanenii]